MLGENSFRQYISDVINSILDIPIPTICAITSDCIYINVPFLSTLFTQYRRRDILWYSIVLYSTICCCTAASHNSPCRNRCSARCNPTEYSFFSDTCYQTTFVSFVHFTYILTESYRSLIWFKQICTMFANQICTKLFPRAVIIYDSEVESTCNKFLHTWLNYSKLDSNWQSYAMLASILC